jgi:hypothetical protein
MLNSWEPAIAVIAQQHEKRTGGCVSIPLSLDTECLCESYYEASSKAFLIFL